MLDKNSFSDILKSRFGICAAISIIGVYLTILDRITLFKILEVEVTLNAVGWGIFVWFSACTFSGIVTSSNVNIPFLKKLYKQFNIPSAYHYWSVLYGLIFIFTGIIAWIMSVLKIIDFDKTGNIFFVGLLLYSGIFIQMNYQEYCFKDSLKTLVLRFFISRLFLGYILVVAGILSMPEITFDKITNNFEAVTSTDFLISVALILLGIVAMFLRREISALISSVVLLAFCAIIILQIPVLLILIEDSSMVKIYYKEVFLTWQLGAAFSLTLATGLIMLNYYWREVKN